MAGNSTGESQHGIDGACVSSSTMIVEFSFVAASDSYEHMAITTEAVIP